MKKKIILIVDDDECYHDIVSQLIENYNFEIHHAYNGEDGINKFEELSELDVVLSDIMMPIVDGIGLLSHIRSSNRPDIPVIMMTSHIKNEFILKALRLGASDFIGKKLDEVSLLNTIDRQINKMTKKNVTNFQLEHLKKASFEFELKAADYFLGHLSMLLLSQIQFFPHISCEIFNKLLIAFDEIINNAFVHGIFELNHTDRYISKEEHQNSLRKQMTYETIKNRFIKVYFKISADEIEITVKDFGKGFNFEEANFDNGEFLNFDPYGRGLSLIFLMTDKLEFFDNGSTIHITKRLDIE